MYMTTDTPVHVFECLLEKDAFFLRYEANVEIQQLDYHKVTAVIHKLHCMFPKLLIGT